MIYQRRKSFENNTCCIYKCRSKYTRALCVWVAKQIQRSKSLGCNKTAFLAFCRLHSNKKQEQLWKDCQCNKSPCQSFVFTNTELPELKQLSIWDTVNICSCFMVITSCRWKCKWTPHRTTLPRSPMLLRFHETSYYEQCFRNNNVSGAKKPVSGDHFYRSLELTPLSEELTPVWSNLGLAGLWKTKTLCSHIFL